MAEEPIHLFNYSDFANSVSARITSEEEMRQAMEEAVDTAIRNFEPVFPNFEGLFRVKYKWKQILGDAQFHNIVQDETAKLLQRWEQRLFRTSPGEPIMHGGDFFNLIRRLDDAGAAATEPNTAAEEPTQETDEPGGSGNNNPGMSGQNEVNTGEQTGVINDVNIGGQTGVVDDVPTQPDPKPTEGEGEEEEEEEEQGEGEGEGEETGGNFGGVGFDDEGGGLTPPDFGGDL